MPALSLASNPLGLECELQAKIHRVERSAVTAALGIATSKSCTAAEVQREANASVVQVSCANFLN